MRKPIKIFFSPLSRRFYASQTYKELRPGIVEVTGQKFDVTDQIAELIERYKITFEAKKEAEPAA